MKRILLAVMLLLTAFAPAMAADSSPAHDGAWLKPTEAQYVCMMNNKVFDKPQIAIDIEGKTYYGCCPMCADKLKNDVSLRTATDPVSGKQVDKASAIIGADKHGMTYYFESKENFDKFASGPMPVTTDATMMHDMGGMTMPQGQSDMGMTARPSATKSGEDHQQHH